MDDSEFHKILRRALEIKAKSDAGYHALRGVNQDVNNAVQDLRHNEEALYALRNSTAQHGSRRQREHVTGEIRKQEALIEEFKVALEVLRAAHDEAQAVVDAYGPQSHNVMAHIQQIRNERNAAAVQPYVASLTYEGNSRFPFIPSGAM